MAKLWSALNERGPKILTTTSSGAREMMTGKSGFNETTLSAVGTASSPQLTWPATVAIMDNSMKRLGRALVVIVDDQVTHSTHNDSMGPLVTELLEESGFIVDGVVLVSAEIASIRNALNTAVIGGVDLVVTVGGTGVSPRDVTPDATQGVLDRPIPGIAEALRASGLAAGAIDAGISRGLVGVSGSTLVVNLAGSRASVRDGMATLSSLVPHVIDELSGLEDV